MTFDTLVTSTGIALPPTLARLMASGRTSYDPDPAQAALNALYDFSWLTPERAAEVIAGWLNPQKQHGNVFLPFGRSGAGDAYCLVRLKDGEEGVCMVWHDSSESTLDFASFDDFVCGGYLTVMANLELLQEDAGADPASCVREDIAKVIDLLPAERAMLLRDCLVKSVTHRAYKHGPRSRPEMVLSWIDQAEEEALQETIARPERLPFKVVARWEE